jgi:hypothetical protein
MVERGEWDGAIPALSHPSEPLIIELPLEPSKGGGSGSFLALGSDGRRWWVKPPNQLQGGKVLVTEHVVAEAGLLIHAPVCEVAVAKIPDELIGWEFKVGSFLESGFAHASLEVPDANQEGQLTHRQHDDNARRHAGVYALYDWCWGGDDQWLYCWSDDRKVYSHDHGWYLPESGADWSHTTLTNRVDGPHELPTDASGLLYDELRLVADSLRRVDRGDLVRILSGVPASWPVSTSDLEALGFFLERRIPQVADRLEARVSASP